MKSFITILTSVVCSFSAVAAPQGQTEKNPPPLDASNRDSSVKPDREKSAAPRCQQQGFISKTGRRFFPVRQWELDQTDRDPAGVFPMGGVQ